MFDKMFSKNKKFVWIKEFVLFRIQNNYFMNYLFTQTPS